MGIVRRSIVAAAGVAVLYVCGTGSANVPQQTEPRQTDGERVPRQPYRRYHCRDRFHRDITFYLSERPSESAARLPLAVFIQGSGNGSVFGTQGSQVVPTMGHGTVQDAFRGQARVLVVEKPGVRFLDPASDLTGDRTAEFRREHTLARWSEAVDAAIRTSLSRPDIDKGRVLVIGHSEGGLVACRVAAKDRRVAAVAVLAGGGPCQLFDLISLARRGALFRDVSDDPHERVQYVLDGWRRIRARPDSDTDLFFGHPFRRWSSFLASSPLAELSRCGVRVFVGQGLDDDAVEPAGADVLYAGLLAAGKDVTLDRVAGTDHSFHLASDPAVDGWSREMERIRDWFLKGSPSAAVPEPAHVSP